MKMSCRDRVLGALNCEDMDRPAAAVFTSCDTIGMMEASGVFWPEAHSDPGLMAKLGCAQADYFGLEAVRAGFCLTEEAEALGCPIDMGHRTGSPMLKGHPFTYNPMKEIYDEPSEVGLPDLDEFLDKGRVKVTCDAIEMMQKTHGEDYCIIGGTTGPFTLAGHLLNTENLVYSVYTDPERAKKWVGAINPYCKAFADALHECGADVIQMSEPSASTDILAPYDFPVHSGVFVKEALSNKDVYRILHICGDSEQIIQHMFDTGVTGLSVEEKVDPYLAIKTANRRGCMIGNVGCSFPLFTGTPEDVRKEALRSADAGFNSISAGCGVPIGTPNENIRALVDAVKGLAPERSGNRSNLLK